MTTHQLYGVTLASDIPLSLPESKHTCDITIRSNSISALPTWGKQDEWDTIGTPDNVTFYWIEAGIFQVSAGSRITYDPASAVDTALLTDTILGEAMGTALLQQNELILHASAICIDNQAWLFAGNSGSGKSSHAAFLLDTGGELITDDMSVIRMVNGRPYVYPGPGQINLWPDTLEGIKMAQEECPLIFPGATKHALHSKPTKTPVPIRGICILEPGQCYAHKRLAGAEAIIALLEQTFSRHLQSTYSFSFLTAEQEQMQLAKITELLEQCKLVKMARPPDLEPISFQTIFDEIQ